MYYIACGEQASINKDNFKVSTYEYYSLALIRFQLDRLSVTYYI